MDKQKMAGGIAAAAGAIILLTAGLSKIEADRVKLTERIRAEIEMETETPTEAESLAAAVTITLASIEAETTTAAPETTTTAPETTETTTEETTEESTTAETMPPQPSTAPTAPETETDAETTTEAQTEPPAPVFEPRYSFTEEEATYLVKTASCEAGNQGVYGMALIMRVVLNRAEQRGMSIHDVLYEPEQFNCVYGDWWAMDYRAEGVYEALEWVRNGWDESFGATFFCTPQRNGWHMSHLTFLFQYGNMQFYR